MLLLQKSKNKIIFVKFPFIFEIGLTESIFKNSWLNLKERVATVSIINDSAGYLRNLLINYVVYKMPEL